MFVFCGVEENKVKLGWRLRDDFRRVAEDLGDVGCELGFFEVFCGEVEAETVVGFDCVEVACVFLS